jgi:copper ion binding protein
METAVIKIEGMHCQHCVSSVRDALSELEGVDTVTVDLEGGSATVSYDAASVQPAALQAAIEDQGFDVVA